MDVRQRDAFAVERVLLKIQRRTTNASQMVNSQSMVSLNFGQSHFITRLSIGKDGLKLKQGKVSRASRQWSPMSGST